VSQSFRGSGHPVVVRHEHIQIVAKLLCRREVNRVQGPKLPGKQCARRVQDAIVHANEIEVLQHTAAPALRFVACRQQRTKNLRTGESARHQRLSAPEIAPQRKRLRFAHGKLHDGRRVEVGGHVSALVPAQATEHVRRMLRSRPEDERTGQVVEVPPGRVDLATSAQALQRAAFRRRREDRHRASPVGDLDGFALLDTPQ